MNNEILEIVLKLFLAALFSGLIGYEREKSQSAAGMKTHLLVGIGSAVVALIQVEMMKQTLVYYAIYGADSPVRVDMARLVAQVVSGIGFLGAGAIVVTKRFVSGLTTAASIWAVASIGIALGMGYYPVAIIGLVSVLSVLFIFKRVWNVQASERLVIKYFNTPNGFHKIKSNLLEINMMVESVRYSTEPFGHELVSTHVLRVVSPNRYDFDLVVNTLSKLDFVISIERTNIEH